MLVHCKLTQGPYATWFWDTVLESFASCHSYGRNFDYLNCFCTRYCVAERPHVWLCHALLVIFVVRFISFNIISFLTITWCWCWTSGKEKLADYLGVGADEARNITHSFLGWFSLQLTYLLTLAHLVLSGLNYYYFEIHQRADILAPHISRLG